MLARYLMLAALVFGLAGNAGTAWAEDAKKAPDVATEWAGLVKEMNTFTEKMEALKLRFSKATAAEKSKIAKEADVMGRKFQTAVYPRMLELAPEVLKINPEDSVAAELTLQTLFSKNQYAELVRVSDVVLKKDPKAQLALNFNGVGKYATHDFEGAVMVLKEAESAGLIIPNLGGQYLDSAEQYIDLWKKEQAIRDKEDAATGDAQLPIVKLSTNKGDIEILLFENEAPNSVANYINLIEKKFYDGTKFHRVIPGFMAQGGDPYSRDKPEAAGTGGPGYAVPCECEQENARMHFAGSLSMAHAGKDTGGSQFFLTHLPTAHLNGKHTVFGRVIKGLDVVEALEIDDEIKSASVVRKRNHEYTPKTLPDPK